MAQDISGMLIKIEATTAQMRAEMKRADAAVAGATKGIDKELSKVDRAFDRIGLGAGKVSAAARSLAPALAGLVTIEALRRAQQLGEEFTLLESRIKRLSGGTAEAAITYSRLAEVARNSGTSLGETVKLWESLTGTLEELGATDAQVVRLTDTLQKIGTIGGSSAQEVSNALRQLGQGLAGGVIRAEEFNSVLEGMPELAREIARGLGVPFSELRQLMLDGELTAESVLGAIQKRAIDVDAEFAKLPRTVSQASAALTNDFGRAISDIDKAIGGSVNLARFLDTLAKGIRFTAGDLTDLERLNQLTAERAKLQQSFEQAERRTLLSSKERATYEQGLKRLNTEILEIQNRRVEQMKEEGRQIKSNGPARNEEYDKYLAKLKESAALQGVNSEVAKVRYAIEKGELGKLTEAQQQALLAYAQEKDAKIESAKASIDHSKALVDQAKAIDALVAKYDPAAKAQADYEEAIALADKALLNSTYTTEQYQKVVQGLYTDLNKPIWDKHNKGADEAAAAIKKIDDQLQSVRDRLDPAGKAARDFAEEQDFLKKAVDEGRLSLEEYNKLLPLLGKEYEENTRATSDWAQWTEGALDRVDSAFADAWRNIGDGFSSFRDSLTDAFKQMLAELAHMAITKPIIMQIGAAMGIGNGTQGNNGIWGSLLGGSSGSGGGGMNWGQMLQYGQSAYSALTGVGPAVMAGWQTGGLGGALSGGAGYYGNLLSGAATTVGGMFGYGGAAASAAAAQAAGAAAGNSLAVNAGIYASGGAAAGAGGVGAGMMAKIAAMASNPVGWFIAAITGMYQSGKLFDAGVRISGDRTGDYDDDASLLGRTAWAPFRVAGTAIEKMDKLIASVVGDKTAAMITGSPITQFVMDKLGAGLFGGQWQTKDMGIGLGVEGGAFGAEQYEYQKKKGGWFKSDKKRTLWSDLDPETAAALQQTYDATKAGVSSIFESLSLTLDEGSLAGLQLAREKISTNGKTEEEIQEAVSEWFLSLSEAMNTELNKVFGTGLDYDLAGMQAFVGNLKGVNALFDQLNLTLYESTVAGGKMAEQLSAVSGGFESLATNAATYYDAFYSAEEKTANTLEAITKAFEAADVKLAGSNAEYRAMVDNIDRTTEAGQEMFATLMALSGQAAQYYSIVEQQSVALATGAVNAAYSAVQRSIAAQQRELQAAATSTASNISALTGVSNSLGAALKRLRGSSDDTVRMLRAQATMTLNGALVTVRAGGSLADYAGLQDALDVASNMDTALYGSLEDFEREQGRTANLVAELEKVNGKQLTAEQQMLKQLESQSYALDEQLSLAQAQLDALNGVDTSVKSLGEAMAALNSSIVAALQAQAAGAAQANTPENNGVLVDAIYKDLFGRETDAAGKGYWTGQLGSGAIDYKGAVGAIAGGAQGSDLAALIGGAYQSALGREADAGGAAYWEQQISAGNLSYVDLQDALKAAAKAAGEVPAFAAGGFHSGGLRLVGENGPELEVTGPSRIYNASQTAAMLGGGDSTAAITSLQRTVEGQSAALRSIAKHTMQTAKRVEFLERWDFDGLPKERAIA